MKEEAILFGGMQSLVGVVTDPIEATRSRPAVVFLNAGIVHRVGPGRIYVTIARALSSAGSVTLRYDFSGIGDSAVRQDHLPFEQSAVRETQAAMDFLEATRGIGRFILLGGCSGAKIALRTAGCDSRVVGVVPINFPIPDPPNITQGDTSRESTHYYFRHALFDRQSWRKLLTGRSNYRRIVSAIKVQAKPRSQRQKRQLPGAFQLLTDLQLLIDRGVCAAFVCSDSDPNLTDLRDILNDLIQDRKVNLEIIRRSDHTFSSLYDQQQLLTKVHELIDSICSHAGPAAIALMDC